MSGKILYDKIADSHLVVDQDGEPILADEGGRQGRGGRAQLMSPVMAEAIADMRDYK